MSHGISYALILAVLGLFAVTFLWKSGRRWQKWGIRAVLGMIILILAIPLILFPAYEPPAVTGSHSVATAEFTWVDENRTETMFVRDVNGKVTLGDMDFVKQVYADNGADDAKGEEQVYRFSREWMQVRTSDENFVLDTILEKAGRQEEPFNRANPEKIGLFGHSMGGASSVELGRTRGDIAAVIDLEGTMFGEYTGFENGSYVYEEEPYPVPLLDVNSRKIYEEAKALNGRFFAHMRNGEKLMITRQYVPALKKIVMGGNDCEN